MKKIYFKLKRKILCLLLTVCLTFGSFAGGSINPMPEVYASGVTVEAVRMAIAWILAALTYMGYKFMTYDKAAAVYQELADSASDAASDLLAMAASGKKSVLKAGSDAMAALKAAADKVLIEEADSSLITVPARSHYPVVSNWWTRNAYDIRDFCISNNTSYDLSDYQFFGIVSDYNSDAKFVIPSYLTHAFVYFVPKTDSSVIQNSSNFYSFSGGDMIRFQVSLKFSADGFPVTSLLYSLKEKSFNGYVSHRPGYLAFSRLPLFFVESFQDLVNLRQNSSITYDSVKTVGSDVTSEKDVSIPAIDTDAIASAVIAALPSTATNGSVGAIDYQELAKAIAAAIAANPGVTVPESTAASGETEAEAGTGAAAGTLQGILDGVLAIPGQIGAKLDAILEAVKAISVTADVTAEDSETVEKSQGFVSGLVNWGLDYINPKVPSGLFSKFPFSIPYDLYLLLSALMGSGAAAASPSISGVSLMAYTPGSGSGGGGGSPFGDPGGQSGGGGGSPFGDPDSIIIDIDYDYVPKEYKSYEDHYAPVIDIRLDITSSGAPAFKFDTVLDFHKFTWFFMLLRIGIGIEWLVLLFTGGKSKGE